MPFCEDCGAEVLADNKFCDSCGASFGIDPVSEDLSSPPLQDASPKDAVLELTPEQREVETLYNVFVPMKCPSCGGNLNVPTLKTSAVCEFCGQSYLVRSDLPSIDAGRKISNWFKLAESKMACDDNKGALKYYDKILEEDSTNYLAWMGKAVAEWEVIPFDGKTGSFLERYHSFACKQCIMLTPPSLKCTSESFLLDHLASNLINTIIAFAEQDSQECMNTSSEYEEEFEFEDTPHGQKIVKKKVYKHDYDDLYSAACADLIEYCTKWLGQLSSISIEAKVKALNICASLIQGELLNKINNLYEMSYDGWGEKSRAARLVWSAWYDIPIPEVCMKPVYFQLLSELPPEKRKSPPIDPRFLQEEEELYQKEKAKHQKEVEKEKSFLPCFVATAVLGNANHPYIRTLRSFRDEILMHTISGRAFIAGYYKIGPYGAKLIGRFRLLRRITMYLLILPLVRISRYALRKRKEHD